MAQPRKKVVKLPRSRPTVKRLAKFVEGLVQRVQQLEQDLKILWNNQSKLQENEQGINAQLAVLVRMTVSRLNTLTEYHNENFGTAIPEVTVETINDLFNQFDEFRQRPDSAQHYHHWYLGKDLSELPELPKEEKQEEHGSPEEEYPEGAVIFGGDYGEKSGKQSDRDVREGTEDALPEMQVGDDDEGEPEDRQEGGVL